MPNTSLGARYRNEQTVKAVALVYVIAKPKHSHKTLNKKTLFIIGIF